MRLNGTGRDFDRWRVRGDLAALERVFDAQAPALLRFGIHLVGDAASAEDLVQEAFLTALERADQYDAERPIERWLAGILVRHARKARRDERRFELRPVPERVDADSPYHAAARRELSAELARAVDALSEPGRAAILLHLQHGLGPAEIAHVLGRSPGAVRVQLHRAREALRKSLPAGIAGALVLLADSARGLDAVRCVVMSRAAQIGPATVVSAGVVSGGLLVKKLVVAALVVLAGLAAFFALRRDPEVPRAPQVIASAPVELAEPDRTTSIATPEPAGEVRRVEAMEPAAVIDAHEKLRGLVLDADTDAPVAGARIALYAPTKMRFSALRARYWDRLEWINWCVQGGYPWPSFERELTASMLADLEDITVRAAPENGVPPIATAVSDAEGRFELAAESNDGFLTCDAAGYAQRTLATRERAYRVDPKSDRTIYVSKGRRMRGGIVDESGAPIRESIALSFYAHAPSGLRSADDQPRDEQDRRVTFRTDSEGRFDIETDAHLGFVRSLDGRWYVHEHRRPESPSARTVWADLLGDKGDVQVVLVPQLSLLVRDAETRAPIEDAYVSVRSAATSSAFRRGWFHLAEGRLPLTPASATTNRDEHRDTTAYQVDSVCSVWAHGYARASVPVRDLFASGVVGVDLRRSTSPDLAGRVHRGAAAAGAARIVAIEASEGRYDSTQAIPVSGAEADAEGRFRLALPDGAFVLVVEHGDARVRRAITVPHDGEIDVDLEATATLTVRVIGADASPTVSRDVFVRDEQRITTRGKTDGAGTATFGALVPGTYVVTVSRIAESRTVELAAGATERVEFTPSDSTPKYAHLVVEDGKPDGWVARRSVWSPGGGGAVEPSGRVPVDFAVDRTFVLVSPAGVTHSILMPPDAADGAEVRLRVGGRGYAGRVVEQSTGSPLKDVVLMVRTTSGMSGMTVPVDTDGRFEVRGLADVDWEISVADATGMKDRPPADVTFEPATRPTDPPTQLVLRQPRFARGVFEGRESVVFEGRVEPAANEVIGALAYLSVSFPADGYTLWLSYSARVGADGRFRLRIPAAGERTLGLYSGESAKKLLRVTWQPSGTDPEPRDFVLPP